MFVDGLLLCVNFVVMLVCLLWVITCLVLVITEYGVLGKADCCCLQDCRVIEVWLGDYFDGWLFNGVVGDYIEYMLRCFLFV